MWAKVDDQWWMHPKVLRLSMPARGLWVTALSYCAGCKTDVVPMPFPEFVCGPFTESDADALATELAESGLWANHPDGWRIIGFEIGTDQADDRDDLTWAELPLLDRDGWECANCAATCAGLQIDHVHPWSQGGADELDNLQWLCPPCNSSKWAFPADLWESIGMAGRMRATSSCGRGECGHDESPRLHRIHTDGGAI